MTGSLAFATDVALRVSEGASVERGATTVVRMPANPGFRWGNFLLVPEAGAPAARVAEHAAAFPDAGFVAVGVDAPHPQLDEGAWLAAGFEIERLAVLTSRRAVQAVDTGVRQLTSDADWSAVTAIALELEGAPDAAHVVFTERRTAEQRGAVVVGRAVWLGVEVDGAIVATAGIADAGSGIARFQDVQTSVRHRRRGHASALIASGVRIATERFGSALVVLVAERHGPAIGLYRRLGFAEVETQLRLGRVDPPSSGLS